MIIIADDKIAIAAVVNGVTLLVPAVNIQDVDSGLYFNQATTAYDSATPAPVFLGALDSYVWEVSLYWNVKIGPKRFTLTHNNGVLVEIAYADAKEQKFFTIDELYLLADTVGLMPVGANSLTSVISQSGVARYSLSPVTGIALYDTIPLAGLDVRPGWTFSARCALTAGGSYTGTLFFPYTYIFGITTDGVTTEDALIIYAEGYPATVFTSGQWGINSTQNGVFPNPILNNTLSQVQLLINDAGVVKILRWDRITGAFLGATVSDAVVSNIQRTYTTDDTSIYFIGRNAVSEDILYKINATTGAKVGEVNLVDLFRANKLGHPYCAWVYAFDGRIYVSADAQSSITVIFDSSLNLINIVSHGFKGDIQGMAFGNGAIYTLIGNRYSDSYAMSLSIMDKTNRVAVVDLPAKKEWLPVMNSDKYSCITVSRGIVYVLTKDINEDPYISAICIDAPQNFSASPTLAEIRFRGYL